MTRIQTHYDNLKVARDAPPEVIRAAYKTLSQKYHPDRNPGSADAARIMSIINTSYAVLSDPARRHEHDQWIHRQEHPPSASSEAPSPPGGAQQPAQTKASPNTWQTADTIGRVRIALHHMAEHWRAYVVSAFVLWVVFANFLVDPVPPPPGPKPYTATPPAPASNASLSSPLPPRRVKPQAEAYQRPSLTPKGRPWPAKPTLLAGYPRLNTEGHSLLTIDNSQGDEDVFAKLVSLDGPKAYPVRVFFVPAHNKFTLHSVTAGQYDVRYRDLDTGDLARTEAFTLTETRTPIAGGVDIAYSNFTFSLYKVPNGNAQTYPLPDDEF